MPTGGGLLQLVATGKQDVFLTGNPQITWFKMVYRRYTNFAMESQAIFFDGDPDFGKRLTCTIPRRGDLLGALTLEVTLPEVRLTDGTLAAYVNSLGHALIEEVSVERLSGLLAMEFEKALRPVFSRYEWMMPLIGAVWGAVLAAVLLILI